jgi:dephospho-CoA kinase
MLRVGLTGGIACGKSLVAGFFRARGIPVVDDDVAARDAVAPGSAGLAAVVAEFGEEILLPDGGLDRPALGRIVFGDDRLRTKLMAILHPRIAELLAERFAVAEGSGAPLMVYESALLVENGGADAWRPLVVVRADRETQIHRLAERNGFPREEAEMRIRSQAPVDEKASLGDYVIDNSGPVAQVAAQFEAVLAALLQRAAEGPSATGSPLGPAARAPRSRASRG